LMQGEIEVGRQDLNVIRERAGLSATPKGTVEYLLEVLYEERKKELFSEWGHRWFDLKRSGKAGTILGNIKPNWQVTDLLYPIPELELEKNPKLTKNPGY